MCDSDPEDWASDSEQDADFTPSIPTVRLDSDMQQDLVVENLGQSGLMPVTNNVYIHDGNAAMDPITKEPVHVVHLGPGDTISVPFRKDDWLMKASRIYVPEKTTFLTVPQIKAKVMQSADFKAWLSGPRPRPWNGFIQMTWDELLATGPLFYTVQ